MKAIVCAFILLLIFMGAAAADDNTKPIVSVSVMNNTFNPKTIFFVSPAEDTEKISYKWNGSTTWHFLKSGSKDISIWKKADGVGTAGGYYTIPEALTPEQVLLVKIVAYNTDGDKEILSVGGLSIYTEDLRKAFHPAAFSFIGILAILIIGTIINLRSMGWK